MSQTSTADPIPHELIGPAGGKALPYRLRRAYAIGAMVWSLQVAALALHPGLAGIQLAPAIGSLAIAALACSVLGLRSDSRGWIRASTGALAGGTVALVHFFLLVSLPQSGDRPLFPVAGMLSVGVAIATLAGLAWGWSRVPAGDRWRRVAMIGVGLSGLALMHLAGLAALKGAALMPPSWAGLAAVFWCGSLGLLLGLRLGDTASVTGGRSIDVGEQIRLVADALPTPIMLAGADDQRILFANSRARAQFGIPDDLGRHTSSSAFYAVAGTQRKLVDAVRRSGSIENHEVQFRRVDGSTFWALASARLILCGGEPAILASCQDISERKAAEAALLDSEIRYALISRAANDGIWDWDIPSGAVYYSARWKQIVGVEPGLRLTSIEDWLGRVHPGDVERLRHDIAQHIAGTTAQLDSEYRMLHGGGRYCWMQCRAIALRNSAGQPIRMAGSQSDITLRKTYEINLLNAAYEDRLTGVNNRAFFNQLVETRNSVAGIEGTAILLLNVDQFRRLNDSLGTGPGDALLIAVARRLARRVAPADALSRIGSDEFAIWLHSVSDHTEASALAEMLLTDLSQPYTLGDVEIVIGVSVGIAAPTLGDAGSGTDLLRNARLALDRAKLLGGARAELFDDALVCETNLKRRLSKDLTGAERLGQIFFHYQPIVSLDAAGTNTIVGFEALMRWDHPQLGSIRPDQFIPIAEETGLIGQLGLFAIECAAGEIGGWTACGLAPDEFSIAVNLSSRQISDRAGVLRMHALLDRLAVPPGRLKLEITESVLMSDPEAMATALHAFKGRGIQLALDDFGTGYSSLSYLHRFPFDVLKIDRSFVSRMAHAPEALRLVRSIIELSHDLGLKVVAEGVEASEECNLLRQLGCDQAQGYYFARPVSSAEARRLLQQRQI